MSGLNVLYGSDSGSGHGSKFESRPVSGSVSVFEAEDEPNHAYASWSDIYIESEL